MNTPAGYIWLILLGLAKANTDEDFVVQLSRTKSSWGNIPHGCHPLLDLQKIREHMSNDTEVWLPIKRIDLKGWYWTNGKYFGTQISSKEWQRQGMDCAVLRSLDKIIDDVYCERNYEHYICEGLQKCDEDNYMYMCLNTTLGVYNIYNQTGTWYDAIERCDHRKQSLAAIGNERLQDILQLVAKRTSLWANIWLGLRKREFRLFNSSTTIRLKTFDWGPSQPSSMKNHDCVYLNVSGNRSSWRTDSCHRPRKHICLYEGGSIPVTRVAENNVSSGYNQHFVTSENMHSTTEMPLSPSCNCTTYLVFIVILFIYALAASGMSVILLYKLKRKGKTESKDMEDQRKTQPLLDRWNQTDKLDAAKPSGETAGDPLCVKKGKTSSDELDTKESHPLLVDNRGSDAHGSHILGENITQPHMSINDESTNRPHNTKDKLDKAMNESTGDAMRHNHVYSENNGAAQKDVNGTTKSSADNGHPEMTLPVSPISDNAANASVEMGETFPDDQAERKDSNEENGIISSKGGAKLLTNQGEVSSNTILKKKSESTPDENRSSEKDKIDEKETSSRDYINHSREDQEEQELTKILSEIAMPTGKTCNRVAQISRIIECGCTFQNVFGPWHVHVYYNSVASCLVTDASYGGFFENVDYIPAQLILIESYRGSSFSLIITRGKLQDIIFTENTENITSERHKDSKKVTCTVKTDKTMLQEHQIKTIRTPSGSKKTDYEFMRNKPENFTTKENKGTAATEEITVGKTSMASHTSSDETIKDEDHNIRPSTSTFDIVFQQSDDSRDFFDIATNHIPLGSETAAVAN